MLIIGLVIAHCVSRAKGSENQIEPAIRNGEQCEIGCPESANVLLWNRFRTDRLTSNVPYAVRSVLRMTKRAPNSPTPTSTLTGATNNHAPHWK